MNWEALGAVGEIVGALAVVVTLAYLALQVRTARKTTCFWMSSAGTKRPFNS